VLAVARGESVAGAQSTVLARSPRSLPLTPPLATAYFLPRSRGRRGAIVPELEPLLQWSERDGRDDSTVSADDALRASAGHQPVEIQATP